MKDSSSLVAVGPVNPARRMGAGAYHHVSLARPASEESSLPRGMWGAEISLEAVVNNTILRQDLERYCEMGSLPQNVRDEVWRQALLQSTRSQETTNPLDDGTVVSVIDQYEPLARFARRIYGERVQSPGSGVSRSKL